MQAVKDIMQVNTAMHIVMDTCTYSTQQNQDSQPVTENVNNTGTYTQQNQDFTQPVTENINTSSNGHIHNRTRTSHSQ